MSLVETSPQIQQITQTLDRLIDEMVALRGQVAALSRAAELRSGSTRQAEYFGMWADRADLPGQTSREWLEQWRQQQWER